MKLCKACSFFRKPDGVLDVSEYALCTQGLQVSPVTGEHTLATQSSRYCLTLRKSEKSGDCGAAARFFQPVQIANLAVPTHPIPALLRPQA